MFENILHALHGWLGNYGLAVIAFTVIVRIVLFPFDFKSRKSMRKMTRLQPKMAVLQKKYANDRDKLNRKMSDLYKQEGVSPLSGCLPMLLSYPILILMFNAMRNYANTQMAQQVTDFLVAGGTAAPAFDPFLWIKNLYMADNPFVSALPNLTTMQAAGLDVWAKVLTPDAMQGIIAHGSALTANFSEEQVALWQQICERVQAGSWMAEGDTFLRDNLQGTLQILGNMMQSTEYYAAHSGVAAGIPAIPLLGYIQKEWNGLIILPVLSAVSQLVMTKLTPTQQQPAAANDPQAQATQSTGKFMTWFFPIFSLWICYSSTAAFALYWVASNLIMMAQTLFINRYLDSKEKKEQIAGEGIVQ